MQCKVKVTCFPCSQLKYFTVISREKLRRAFCSRIILSNCTNHSDLVCMCELLLSACPAPTHVQQIRNVSDFFSPALQWSSSVQCCHAASLHIEAAYTNPICGHCIRQGFLYRQMISWCSCAEFHIGSEADGDQFQGERDEGIAARYGPGGGSCRAAVKYDRARCLRWRLRRFLFWQRHLARAH
jgi:hypothetical protein